MKIYTNTVDTIVAKDKEDLLKIFEEHYGSDEEVEEDGYYEWTEIETLDKELIIRYWIDDWDYINKDYIPADASIERDEDAGKVLVAATYREWVEVNGRGILCSTEY